MRSKATLLAGTDTWDPIQHVTRHLLLSTAGGNNLPLQFLKNKDQAEASL